MRFVRIAAALIAVSIVGTANAQVSSGFGVRRDPFNGSHRMHAGFDMPGRIGTPIYATGDGYIRRARMASGYGNLVEIEHGFGYQTRYGHLSRMLVQEGQFVRRGEMIALMGSTGRSTGSHLHYEVRVNGRPVPPGNFMQIVFASQPDWNAVRMAAVFRPGVETYAAPVQRVGSVAMALSATRRQRQLAPVDIEISYGQGQTKPAGKQPGSSFSSGHVKFGN